jgi:hypothetical protein
MSIVSPDHHYIRTGEGGELLYDPMVDPFERVNILESAHRRGEVEGFRRMLLELLTENPGSGEVERAYLDHYRRSLERLVREAPARRVAVDPRIATDVVSRSGRPGP